MNTSPATELRPLKYWEDPGTGEGIAVYDQCPMALGVLFSAPDSRGSRTALLECEVDYDLDMLAILFLLENFGKAPAGR